MNQLNYYTQNLISNSDIDFTATLQSRELYNEYTDFSHTMSSLEGIQTITFSKPSYVCFIDKINNITLNEPIYLSAEYLKTGKIFIVRNEELNLWGEGNSYEEAIMNFERFFLHDYRICKKAKRKGLDKYTKDLFEKYKKYLNKK